MRLGLAIWGVFLLPAAAAAQVPYSLSGAQYIPPLELDEMRRQGRIAEGKDPSDDAPPSTGCVRALGEIGVERAASDWALRRGEDGPADLKQSYEHEMYYADRRLKAITGLCLADGKLRSHDFGRWTAKQTLSTNRQGCEIVAKDCRPRKHW